MYTYRCPKCGNESDEFRSVANRNVFPSCEAWIDIESPGENYECGVQMQRVVSAPFVAADMSPYRSMITGEMISSRSQHRAHLKAHNCIEIGNETKYLKPKEKIDLAPESKKARKQKIIDQVNALK
jgi:hypothetical protein